MSQWAVMPAVMVGEVTRVGHSGRGHSSGHGGRGHSAQQSRWAESQCSAVTVGRVITAVILGGVTTVMVGGVTTVMVGGVTTVTVGGVTVLSSHGERSHSAQQSRWAES